MSNNAAASPSRAGRSTAQLVSDFNRCGEHTQMQAQLLARLEHLTKARPLPARFSAPALAACGSDGGVRPARVETMSQFEKWAAERDGGALAAQAAAHAEGHGQELPMCAAQIGEYARGIAKARDAAAAWSQMAEATAQQFSRVQARTAAIHSRAQEITRQQRQKEALAEALERRLWHFDQLYMLTTRLYSAPGSPGAPGSAGLASVLGELDQCIEFLLLHRSYHDAAQVLQRYRELQSRALTGIKTHVIDALRSAARASQQPLSPKAQDGVDASAPLYVQFRTLATKLRPQCAEIEKRAGGKEFAALLSDCHSCYFQQRRLLISAFVADSMRQAAAVPDLPSAVRALCSFTLRMNKAELALYGQFFKSPSPLMRMLVEWIASSMREAVRPLLIRAQNIDHLCAVAAIVRSEVLEAEAPFPGDLDMLQASFEALLREIQERLMYLAQKFVQEEIVSFVPTDADLDYPAKLRDSSGAAPAATIQALYNTWYPTLQRTLTLLSKLYLTMDMKVFEGLAFDCVDSCIESLHSAGEAIEGKKTVMDGQLFLVKHLLTLREQIVPFSDVAFSAMEVTLDFTHTRSELRKVLSGEFSSIFSLDTYTPRVYTDKLDSRKRLERELSASIERFVVRTTKQAAGSLFSHLVQVSSFEKVQSTQALKEQPWATKGKFVELSQAVSIALKSEISTVAGVLFTYLAPGAAKSLLQPIRDNVIDSWDQFSRVYTRLYCNDEAQSADIVPLSEITSIFDSALAQGAPSPSTGPSQ